MKGVAGFSGHSYALIADAIESLGDVFTSLIVLAGLKISSKAPDIDHPYGHGKAEPMASIVVAIALIAASVIIAVESVHNIRTPHEVPESFTLIVLLVVIIVKELLFRYVVKVGEEIHSNVVKADALHHRSDAITSVFAFLGIGIAIIGGPGYEAADDWAALAAAGIILFNALNILRPAVAELMDAAPTSEILEEVKQIALSVPQVKGLDKAFARKMGLVYYIDLHVVVDGKLSVREGHAISHKVKDAILEANHKISDVLIHIEPDSTQHK